jgi:hypothetical protein
VEHRLYLLDPGWRPALKSNDQRAFCYHADEADGTYHRIAAGEIYLANGDEMLCLNCAFKRGLTTHERPRLREPIAQNGE